MRDARAIEGRDGMARAGSPARAIGEQQHGVAVGGPEAAQHHKRRLRQRHEAVLVSFGAADMHPVVSGVDVAHPEAHDLVALAKGMIDAAGIAGESDQRVLVGRVCRAALGYLEYPTLAGFK